LGKRTPAAPPELLTLLKTFTFPGNIRELQSMIFDAVSRHKSGILSLQTFRAHIGSSNTTDRESVAQTSGASQVSPPIEFTGAVLPTIKQATDLLVREAMQRANGNQSVAAGMLGISQQALSKRLRKEREAQAGPAGIED
jgi:DNA-binding NtrC family response regulator